MALIYYAQRIQSKVSKRNRCMEQSLGKLDASFHSALPMASHRVGLMPSAMNWDTMCERLPTKEAH